MGGSSRIRPELKNVWDALADKILEELKKSNDSKGGE